MILEQHGRKQLLRRYYMMKNIIISYVMPWGMYFLKLRTRQNYDFCESYTS